MNLLQVESVLSSFAARADVLIDAPLPCLVFMARFSYFAPQRLPKNAALSLSIHINLNITN